MLILMLKEGAVMIFSYFIVNSLVVIIILSEGVNITKPRRCFVHCEVCQLTMKCIVLSYTDIKLFKLT